MEFGILGAVEAWRGDGTPFPIGGPQVRALLAVLALEAGRVVGRERLIDELYGEQAAGDVGHALQSQVSRLRRALRSGLGEGEFVESAGAGYRLAAPAEAVDAHRFARLAGLGRKALRDNDPAAALPLLEQALALWRGPALADVRDAPFAQAQAARLDEARLAAEEDRAEAALAVGEPDAVLGALSELVAAHPLRERARALLMRALYAAGRQAEALDCFERGRRLLADELGTDPSAELMAAHLAILRADELAPASDRRLPTPLTSFIGRETELSELLPLLAQSRLVTLVGPGGTGKTRLALAAASRLRGEVRFIDLAPLTDGHQIPQAVAAALGATAGGEVERRLRTMLADRRIVLILDNCEQVVLEAARFVHRLLVDCPGVRVLATSREALRITGESVFVVPQLPLAKPDSPLADQLSGPAVRLFADRASAVRPGFTVDAGTIGMVARICARLDGLPLAIELAAARLRTLELPEIDARLSDRFRLLARGDRTAEPRHQTLQAVVAWSWDLLDSSERQLAQRFSVFAGGATAAAARQVCGLDDIDDLLADLVDKSLLNVGQGRYRMLETIREFARRRSLESGDHERTQRAHAEYFTTLAETSDPLLRGPSQLDHLTRLAADHDNLQSALHWSAAADPALAARLIAAQAWFWWLTGRPGDGPELARKILPQLDSSFGGPECQVETDAARQVELDVERYALCVAVAARGRVDFGSEVERAAAGLAALKEPLRQPHVILLLALAGGMVPGEPATLRRLFGSDAWSQAFLRLGDGLGLFMSGKIVESEPEFAAALAGFRATGDRWAIAASLDKLAAVAERQGDRTTALALIDEAIAVNTELGWVADTAELLTQRGDIRLGGEGEHRDIEAARADYERAAELARTHGATDMHANALRGLGDAARIQHSPAAHTYYAAVLDIPVDGSPTLAAAHEAARRGLALLDEA
ncbi:BTAD domain-containing putative transcriptional regulator [Nocardia sp. CDC153]|uniref:BTAD domain-containing putative transcriptional regulator n=1 Tax=Nocardia sp. CDC153 TaxID=3112167 RepID=UPI002DBFA209|nr:BTAD domain-containing putative transcriptional regulator [Nocardia sp. CDC153]MEC3954324.1 BTAD domain-containing putative transcriptional regulator [Nocardia sp. CDC153]